MVEPTKQEVLDYSPMNRGGTEELPEYRRSAYGELEKALERKLILAVTGLRRVGKTTLIKQLMGKKGFYFSFDEKKYANPGALKKVVDVFLSEGEKPLIALDEVFRVDDWAGVIKKYHDQKRARFIVSGSSALMVKKGVESLSGRMLERYLPPLSFREYLELNGKKPETAPLDGAFNIRKRFADEALEFMKNGSFPEIVGADEKAAREYIKTSTVEKIVFDDIPSTFRIEHVSKLYDLLGLCAANSSRLFTEVGFAEALQISRHTISDYLLYLQKAFLTEVLYHEGSHQKALKKQKKVFVKTASVYWALNDAPGLGQAAETAVFDKIQAEKPLFYTDSQKREVDFVTNLPIEVKYQTAITSGDLHNLLYYMDKRKKKRAVLVTKDFFDEKTFGWKKITCLPLDVFLLTNPIYATT